MGAVFREMMKDEIGKEFAVYDFGVETLFLIDETNPENIRKEADFYFQAEETSLEGFLNYLEERYTVIPLEVDHTIILTNRQSIKP